MSQRTKLEGKKFGRLVVVEFIGSRSYGSSTKPFYRCVCDCGQEIEAESQNLKSGNTKSCGCFSKEMKSGANSNLYKGVGKLKAEYNRQISTAKKRDLEFTLTVEETKDLFDADCFYCGDAPTPDVRGLVRNGIDRVDSSKGYTKENTVTCCGPCNVAKSDKSQVEFLNRISRIYEKHLKVS